MSDIPAPKNLHVGFAFDQSGTHTFALGWELDSTRKTIRYFLEFSVDKKRYVAVPPELCTFQSRRVDVPFSDVVRLMQDNAIEIRTQRTIFWRLIAEYHDTSGEKVFGRSTSNVTYFEMPLLE